MRKYLWLVPTCGLALAVASCNDDPPPPTTTTYWTTTTEAPTTTIVDLPGSISGTIPGTIPGSGSVVVPTVVVR